MAALVAVWLMVTFSAGNSWAQNFAGVITETSGNCSLKRGSQMMAAVQGTQVQVGDRLTADRGAHLTVTMLDKSRLQLAEGSEISIDQSMVGAQSHTAVRIGLSSGRLRSIVSAAVGGLIPGFEVRTSNAVAGVRGTDFEVAYSRGLRRRNHSDCTEFTDVAVYRGTVHVASAAAPAVGMMITEGFETSVACGASPDSPTLLGIGDTAFESYDSLYQTPPVPFGIERILPPPPPPPPPLVNLPPVGLPPINGP